jgi:hypothetical protein
MGDEEKGHFAVIAEASDGLHRFCLRKIGAISPRRSSET